MRVHPALLLVAIAFTIPVIVELRTILVWIDVELTVVQTVVIGVVTVAAILTWALLPEQSENGSGASG